VSSLPPDAPLATETPAGASLVPGPDFRFDDYISRKTPSDGIDLSSTVVGRHVTLSDADLDFAKQQRAAVAKGLMSDLPYHVEPARAHAIADALTKQWVTNAISGLAPTWSERFDAATKPINAKGFGPVSVSLTVDTAVSIGEWTRHAWNNAGEAIARWRGTCTDVVYAP